MIEAMIEALIDPLHALHFLLPTGDSRSGRRSFDSKHLPSPARRGSRSRPPLRRPRPLRFERLPVPVWNPYSRGRLRPAKSEDRKGAHLAAVLLSHPPQHLLAKRPQLGPRARPPHVAMLQPGRPFAAIPPPQPLRLPITHLQQRRRVHQLQLLALHSRQHFHSPQLTAAHRCSPQCGLLPRPLIRGHFNRGEKGTLSSRYNTTVHRLGRNSSPPVSQGTTSVLSHKFAE